MASKKRWHPSPVLWPTGLGLTGLFVGSCLLLLNMGTLGSQVRGPSGPHSALGGNGVVYSFLLKERDRTDPLGAVVGVHFSNRDPYEIGLEFISNGYGLLWAVMWVGMHAVWFTCVGIGSWRVWAFVQIQKTAAGRPPVFPSGYWPAVFWGAVAFMAVVGPVAVDVILNWFSPAPTVSDYVPLVGHHEKVIVGYLTAGLAAGATVLRLWVAVADTPRTDERSVRATDIDAMQKAGNELRECAFALGLMLSLAVLTASAFAAAARDNDLGLHLPAAEIVGYGIYYTFVLAIVIAPAYAVLAGQGRSIALTVYPTQPSDPNAAFEKRQKFLNSLGLETGWVDSLKAAIVLLSPFLSSLPPLFFAKT
jgi:hypothetical protein